MERGEFWEMSVPREKHNLCVPLGCLIAEKKCFKQKICMANFLSFYHEPRAFWTAYWPLVFSFRMNIAAFPRAPDSLQKGKGIGQGKGREGIL